MELLTVQETAALLRVSPVTVRRYISSGRLTAVHVGRNVRIEREDVEKLPTQVDDTAGERPKLRKTGYLTMDDPLWKLVGIATSTDGVTDVSANKHKYLAEGYLSKHLHTSE